MIESNERFLSSQQQMLKVLREARNRIDFLEKTSNEPIAIIGMGCRFPKANNIEAFWELLHNSRDAVGEIDSERWRLLPGGGIAAEDMGDLAYCRFGGWLDRIDHFDANFFGIAPSEACATDPQQRILLEVAWETIENAGYRPKDLAGTRTGVFIGISGSDYGSFIGAAELETAPLLGSSFHAASGRLSHYFGFQGPCISLDTACSSSLVAVNEACVSLQTNRCNMAMVGGVNLILTPSASVASARAGVLSMSGKCRSFDQSADGYVRGEGCGLVMLKRLSDAVSDHDNIVSIIRGVAVNHCGRSAGGLTYPNGKAQMQLAQEALHRAGVDPDSVSLIEAHGTGTRIGDPIELNGVVSAYGKTNRTNPLYIGSVKTNVGHLEAAAGIAGLIKTSLALSKKEIPANIHFVKGTQQFEWTKSPFLMVPTKSIAWTEEKEHPRRAAVSSIGLSGTNAHAVLEEYQAPQSLDSGKKPVLIVLSAKTETALDGMTEDLGRWLTVHDSDNLSDISSTLQQGREEFRFRRTLVAADRLFASHALLSHPSNKLFTSEVPQVAPEVVLVLSGAGELYPGICQELYRNVQVFRNEVDRCNDIASAILGTDFRKILFTQATNDSLGQVSSTAPRATLQKLFRDNDVGSQRDESDQTVKTAFNQVLTFILDVAMAKMWFSWGVKPCALIGYSVGEYAAAHLSGVMTLEDAMSVVARRAACLDKLPQGAMIAVPLPPEEIVGLLKEATYISAENGPLLTIVSGTVEAVRCLQERLSEDGIFSQRLRTTHAFHSPLIAGARNELIEIFSTVKLHPPQIPYVSNLTGGWITNEQAMDPCYWADQMCSAVKFWDGLSTLCEKEVGLLLEVGPGQSLCGAAVNHDAVIKRRCAVLATCGANIEAHDELTHLFETVGKLWMYGVVVDWRNFPQKKQLCRIPLPTYQFDHQKYWTSMQSDGMPGIGFSDGHQTKSSLQLWEPVWNVRHVPHVKEVCSENGTVCQVPNVQSCWLIFDNDHSLTHRIADYLRGRGDSVVIVIKAQKFCKLASELYSIDASYRDHYNQLIEDLKTSGLAPDRVLYVWGDNDRDVLRQGSNSLNLANYNSVLYLLQAVGRGLPAHPLTIGSVVLGKPFQGNGPVDPEVEMTTTLLMVAHQENEHLDTFIVGVDSTVTTGQLHDYLVKLFTSKDCNSYELLTKDCRWTRGFIPIQDSHVSVQSYFKTKGVYIVTGGLGGIGLALARHLSSTVKAHLVLLVRTEFPVREQWESILLAPHDDSVLVQRIKRIQEMESLGAVVEVITVDIVDEVKLSEVMGDVAKRLGKIDGIFHLAGLPGSGLIQTKTQAQIGQVFSPKIAGTLALIKSLASIPSPDFVALFSSTASLAGGVGQADYAAANGFMDAIAQLWAGQQESGPRVVSINWDAWQHDSWQKVAYEGFGKAVSMIDSYRERFGITFEQGMESLEQSLWSGLPQVVVSHRHPYLIKKSHTNSAALQLLTTESFSKETKQAYSRPPLCVEYQPPTNEIENALVDLWQDLLGIQTIGINDNFFELGGNSLIGMKGVALLRETFSSDVPLHAFFIAPTVAELSISLQEWLLDSIEDSTTVTSEDGNGEVHAISE